VQARNQRARKHCINPDKCKHAPDELVALYNILPAKPLFCNIALFAATPIVSHACGAYGFFAKIAIPVPKHRAAILTACQQYWIA